MKFLRFFGEAHHEKLDSIQVANGKREKKNLTFEDDEQAREKIIKELIFVVVPCIFQCATVIE